MRLTVYTDYALRVMMYLAVKHKSGELSTIDDIVAAYKISRAHVAKIVYDLGVNGMILTVRGRMGGIKLACAPEDISIGDIVRSTEKDFAVVECHDAHVTVDCAILPFCNLKSGFKRAIDAFLSELDQMTLAASIKSMSSAAGEGGLAEIPGQVCGHGTSAETSRGCSAQTGCQKIGGEIMAVVSLRVG